MVNAQELTNPSEPKKDALAPSLVISHQLMIPDKAKQFVADLQQRFDDH